MCMCISGLAVSLLIIIASYIMHGACLVSQFQSGMQFPMTMDGNQDGTTLPWIQDNENQPVILSKDSDFITQRLVKFDTLLYLVFPLTSDVCI